MSTPTEDETITSAQDDAEEVRRILLQLNAAIKNTRLYPQGHPRLKESIAKLFAVLRKHMEKREDVVIRFLENQVVFHSTPLYEISGAISGFVRACFSRQFQGFTFSRNLSLEELADFVMIMNIPPEELQERGGLQEELLSHGVSHITIEKLADQEDELSDDEERKLAKQVYSRTISQIKQVMESVRLGQTINNVEGVKEVVNDMIESLLREKSALISLASIKNYDEYTFHHSVNVGILSLALGSHLSLQKDMLEGLGVGGLLHDVGKTSIPERILNKPGKLDSHEWNVMRSHPVAGAKTLRKTQGVSNCAPVIAFEHHIKYDLTGYPSLVKQRPLSSYSLVVGIADCYDAMTTLRPYQKPRMPAEALKIMLELIGRDFEPRLMSRFLEMMGVYPVGSFVRLDTNEFAVVYSLNPEEAERPTVKVITDSKGQSLPSVKVVDLRDKAPSTGNYERSIVQVLDPVSKGVNIANYL